MFNFNLASFQSSSDSFKIKVLVDICEQKNERLFENIFFYAQHDLNSHIISSALLSTLEKNNLPYFYSLLEMTDKYGIMLRKEHIRGVYNCALVYKNFIICDMLDKRFNVLEEQMINEIEEKQLNYSINEHGQYNYINTKELHKDVSENKINPRLVYFDQNSFLLASLHRSSEPLNYILSHSKIIAQSLLESAFINQIQFKETVPDELISHSLTRDKIRQSKTINLYLNNNESFLDIKEKAKSFINSVKLKYDLEKDLTIQKQELPKIKL